MDPLPAGQAVTISDAIVVFHDATACDERDSALRFLQLLGTAYRLIHRPPTQYRDWVGRAEQTLHDLQAASEATIRHYGHTYIHPYTAAEYPDIMVQMSVIAAIHDFAAWTGAPIAFEEELSAGLVKFHDTKLARCAAICPMSAAIRTRMRSIAGICIIRCSISVGWRSMATRARGISFSPRSITRSAPGVISAMSGRSSSR